MIRVKTNDQHRMGVDVNLPFLGETNVSSEGYVQVDTKEKADKLVAAEIGFFYDDTSFLNHVGSEEELVGQNDSLKDQITILTNEKTLLSTNLRVSEERNVKLNEQLKDTASKLKSAGEEIIKLRSDLTKMTSAYKDASVGISPKSTTSTNEVEPVTVLTEAVQEKGIESEKALPKKLFPTGDKALKL